MRRVVRRDIQQPTVPHKGLHPGLVAHSTLLDRQLAFNSDRVPAMAAVIAIAELIDDKDAPQRLGAGAKLRQVPCNSCLSRSVLADDQGNAGCGRKRFLGLLPKANIPESRRQGLSFRDAQDSVLKPAPNRQVKVYIGVAQRSKFVYVDKHDLLRQFMLVHAFRHLLPMCLTS